MQMNHIPLHVVKNLWLWLAVP